MSQRLTRREFATAGAAALGLPVLQTEGLQASGEPGGGVVDGFPTLAVRPYQLMCVI
jgi:hypothetical protein